jgi:hypothetical protein
LIARLTKVDSKVKLIEIWVPLCQSRFDKGVNNLDLENLCASATRLTESCVHDRNPGRGDQICLRIAPRLTNVVCICIHRLTNVVCTQVD